MGAFSALAVEWLCNPVLAALLLVATARTCELAFPGEKGVAGWAMLFTLASPAFVAQGISFYAMTALLLANMVFVWVFSHHPRTALPQWLGRFRSAGDAQPVPAPVVRGAVVDLVPLAPPALRQWRHWRRICAPGAAAGGRVGSLQGKAFGRIRCGRRVGTVGLGELSRRRRLFHAQRRLLWQRLAGTVKLWIWAVPGLLVLAGMGFAFRRNHTPARLLGPRHC
jgi:hypothetical protein